MFSWWWKGAISTTLQSSIPDSSQLHYCILSWLPNYPKIISVSPSTDITTKLLHCPCWEEWQKHRQRSATIPWNGIQQWKPQFFRCIRRSSSKVLCVKGLLPWPTKPQAPPGNHQTHWQVADPRESPFLLTGVEKMLLYLDVWSPHESSWDNCIVFIGHFAIWASRRRILSSSKTWAGRSLWTSSMKMFGIPDSNSPQGCHKKHHDGKHFFWVSLSIYAYVGNDHNTKKSCTGYCISI